MKMKLSMLVLMALMFSTPRAVQAQTTAFTYQGRLMDGGSPASGSYDLRFYLRDAAVGGSAVGITNTIAPVAVSNGLFTVVLDFTSAPFVSGGDRWLEIGVRTNGSVAAYSTLAPRQLITSTPYAITAGNVTGELPASQISGTLPSSVLSGNYSSPVTFNNPGDNFTGNGSGLSGVNASLLGGLSTAQFWQLGGNASTTPGVNYLGTPDSKALEFKVNGARAMRIEPDSLYSIPNIIGGSSANFVGTGSIGNVIAGGGYAATSGTNYIMGGGNLNVISGGYGNRITNGYENVIAGGELNVVGSDYGSSIVGGSANTIVGDYAAIVGGIGNQLLGDYGLVGGYQNIVSTNCTGSVVVGGTQNKVDAMFGGPSHYSFVGGGVSNRINFGGDYCVIAGGLRNVIDDDSDGSVIVGGTSNFIGISFNAVVVGGSHNRVGSEAEVSFIGGGSENIIGGSSRQGGIVAGISNTINGLSRQCFIGAGQKNSILLDTWAATIGGGFFNVAGANFSMIPGGSSNSALGQFSFAAGRRAKANHDGAFVWADSQDADFVSTADDQLLIRAAGGVCIGKVNPGFSVASNFLNLEVGVITNGRLNGISFREFSNSDFGMSLGYDGTGGGDDNRLMIYDVSGVPRFSFESGGNLGLGVANPANPIQHSSGALLTPAGVWQNASDVNRKTDFAPVNSREVLAKLTALPVRSWRYTNEIDSIRHLGPTAQDFKAAFGLGTEETSIGTIDEEGVALVAIQGLNQKLEEKESEIRNLRQRLERLEQLLEKKTGDLK